MTRVTNKLENFLNTPSGKRETSSKTPKYEERIVAFVDVLGMSEFMRNIKHDDDNDAFNKHENILETSNIFNSLFNDNTDIYKMEISDSFVISVLKNDLDDLIMKLAKLQVRLLVDTNFLVRGAISFDKIIGNISNDRIIGPAFVDAHDMETKNVIYPRIVLKKDNCSMVKDPKLIEKDTDNFFFINYFSMIKENDKEEINEIIKKWDEEKDKVNHSIQQKREWFKTHFYKFSGESK